MDLCGVDLTDRADPSDPNSLVEGGLTVVEGGPTVVDGGPTVVEGGQTVVEGGLTFFEGGPTFFEGGLTFFEGGPTVGQKSPETPKSPENRVRISHLCAGVIKFLVSVRSFPYKAPVAHPSRT